MILGTDSSASLVGELTVAEGGGLEDWLANFELKFENHEGFRDNDGLLGEEPLLDSPFFDSRVKPGLGGIGLGWVAAPFPLDEGLVSVSPSAPSWDSCTGLGADDSRGVWLSEDTGKVGRRKFGDRSISQEM